MPIQSPIVLPAGAQSSSPSPDSTYLIKNPQPAISNWIPLNEDKKKENAEKKRRECYGLERLITVTLSDEDTDSASSLAKRSNTSTLKEVPSNPPNTFKYQLDKLNSHIKHNTDSPSSPDPEIDMVHIKETTELKTSHD